VTVPEGAHQELMLRAIASEGDGHRAALRGEHEPARLAYEEAASSARAGHGPPHRGSSGDERSAASPRGAASPSSIAAVSAIATPVRCSSRPAKSSTIACSAAR